MRVNLSLQIIISQLLVVTVFNSYFAIDERIDM